LRKTVPAPQAIAHAGPDAAFRRDAGRGHFEQIELRRDLEERVLVLLVAVQVLHVRDHLADRVGFRALTSAARALAKLGQGGRLELAAQPRPAAGLRPQPPALHRELPPHALGRVFDAAGEVFEPGHDKWPKRSIQHETARPNRSLRDAFS
jgi:hypothetical protein